MLARLSYPEREVYTLSGDGAFAMMMQEYMTQLKYNLPMVNIVICNESYGFIQVAQEMENNDTLGVDLTPMDYAKFAEACGGVGYHVETYDELMDALKKSKGTQVPVIIDVKVTNVRHLPAHAIVTDESLYSKEEVAAFKEKYEVFGMPVLREILKDLK
ncbi:thiamine pyrophosphate-dependent enzyme [Erysipelothrix sp. D19-032]